MGAFSLTVLPFTPFGGGAIQQSFIGNAGDILFFDWNYLSSDPGEDYAYVVLDGKPAKLTDFFSTHPSPNTLFGNETGYRTFAAVLPTSGMHTLGIGVMSTLDQSNASAILVDNATVTPVPEPSTWLLLASGMVGIALVGRRRKRS